MAEPWVVEVRRGSAQELHDLLPPEPPTPCVWVCEPTSTAVVRGSTQRDLPLGPGADRDPGTGGFEVAQRRSGGGLVLVDPDATVWIDAVVPHGHPQWHDDVGVAMHWMGETWVRALEGLGLEASVHRGPLRRGRFGHLVCSASLGPGEVVDGGGRKLVGISQRRTRDWARLQTIASVGPDPLDLATVAGLGAEDADALRAELGATTAVLPFARSVVIDAVLAALPR